jgi:DNA-binding transcriptional regulator YiaG
MAAKKAKCRACDGTMAVTDMSIERLVAGHTFRGKVRGLKCGSCNAGEVDGSVLRAFEVSVALALTSAPPTGAAVKWVRKALGYTGAELGALLGVRPETVSRWERDERAVDHAAWALLGLLAMDQRRTEAALRSTGAVELPAEVAVEASRTAA